MITTLKVAAKLDIRTVNNCGMSLVTAKSNYGERYVLLSVQGSLTIEELSKLNKAFEVETIPMPVNYGIKSYKIKEKPKNVLKISSR